MNINEIITEADILVPNAVDQAQKLIWLNAVNQDFFNVVKIPTTKRFDYVSGQSDYSIPGFSEKDIDRVSTGVFWYGKMNYKNITTTQSYFTYENETLSLYPAPYKNGVGLVRGRKSATTTFLSTNTSIEPDLPKEYHWTLIPALASYLANTEDDGLKAANYESQYKSAWNIAAQNYQVEGENE